VTQRGNNRAKVFFTSADKKYYLMTLARYCGEFRLRIWAYCLMDNHIHLVAVPQMPFSLAMGIGRTNLIYTQYVNRKYHRTGRLWQNRFFSAPVDGGDYLRAVCRYIERNPVRARRVKKPWDYRWSSARHHVRGTPDLLIGKSPWLDPSERSAYREYLEQRSGSEEVERIRTSVQTGRPYGDPEFISELEFKLARILRPGRRGPKPKR